jgi:hypothetical protein
MRKRKYPYRLPDYLAGYLINADATGLTDQEQTEIDLFLKKERVTIIEMREDSNFYHSNDLNKLGADCSTYVAHKIIPTRTIDKIITRVNGQYGAPHARNNIGLPPTDNVKVYDCRVPLSSDPAYDKGGAYWGLPDRRGNWVRVKYTKDLSYVEFYRPAN